MEQSRGECEAGVARGVEREGGWGEAKEVGPEEDEDGVGDSDVVALEEGE